MSSFNTNRSTLKTALDTTHKSANHAAFKSAVFATHQPDWPANLSTEHGALETALIAAVFATNNATNKSTN